MLGNHTAMHGQKRFPGVEMAGLSTRKKVHGQDVKTCLSFLVLKN